MVATHPERTRHDGAEFAQFAHRAQFPPYAPTDALEAPIKWPHGRTVVGVVHDGRRQMVDTPSCPARGEEARGGGFRTTARSGALPWPSMGEDHVVLDTLHRRALVVAPFTAGEVPRVPGTELDFESIPGMLRLEHRGYWSSGLSFSPEGRRAASIEVHEDGSHLVTLDLRTGERHYVGALPGLGGDEPPMWSPDGRWVLASSERATVLVSPAHRVRIELSFDVACASATWWPQVGPSSLMLLHGEPGAQAVSSLNLATGERADVAPVRLEPDECDGDLPGRVRHPMMSPDGDRVLVGDTRGAPAEYQRQWGSAERLAVLDPRTGEVVRLSAAFVGDSLIERSQSRWSWSAPQRHGAPVMLHSSLRAAARPLEGGRRGDEPRSRAQSLWLWDAGAAARGEAQRA